MLLDFFGSKGLQKALTACLERVGQHAGMSDKPKLAPWVNMQEWHTRETYAACPGVGQHAGIVGQHK